MNTNVRLMMVALAAIVTLHTDATAQEVYRYDAVGRLASVTYPDRKRVDFSYDANSNILSIVTGISTVPGETMTRDEIVVTTSPNPARSRFRVDVALERSALIALEIIALDGSHVGSVSEWVHVERTKTFEANTISLADGNYVVRLRAIANDGSVRTAMRTITVVR